MISLRMVSLLAVMLVGLSACNGDADGSLQGYVEGDFLQLAAREPGTLDSLPHGEGDTVEAGGTLFALNDTRAKLAIDRAVAAYQEADSRLNDLSAGGRKEEIEAADQRLERAKADLAVAKSTYERTSDLNKQGFASRQRLDETKAAYETAQAALQEAESQAKLVRLPSRTDTIAAAKANASAAEAAAEMARQDLLDLTVKAPKAGRVEAIYFRPGEFVPAGQPVVSFLPPENVKVRFFLPEPELGRVQLGDDVQVACDNCPEGLTARIDFIAAEAEFTPPVIYSRNERAKLVFMVEARSDEITGLRPGQPVDVRLSE